MSEVVSVEKIDEIVEKLLEKKLENYFRMSRPGFNIESNQEILGHPGKGEFCMTTDTLQGIHFYDQGNCKLGANKSIEIYAGDDNKNGAKDMAIVLEASNGSVKITAKSHDLILQGNNVKIHAEDTIQLKGKRLIDITSPTFQTLSTNLELIGIKTANLLGGEVDLYGETIVEISEGVDNLLNTDIVSRLTKLADEIKKLLIFSI